MFDISNELSTKTIKRLYYYIVNRFFISKVIIWSNILQIPIFTECRNSHQFRCINLGRGLDLRPY